MEKGTIMCDWNGWHLIYGGGLMIGLKMLLVWLIPLGLAFAFVIYLTYQSRSTSNPETAISLLEKAYARGDIGREEFLQKREDILGTNKTTL